MQQESKLLTNYLEVKEALKTYKLLETKKQRNMNELMEKTEKEFIR